MARQRYLRPLYTFDTSRRVVVVAASVSFSEAPANRWTDSAIYFMFPEPYAFSQSLQIHRYSPNNT